MRKTRLLAMLVAVFGCGIGLVAGAGQARGGLGPYEIATLGLTDAEHTRDDGYRYSSPRDLNEAGQVLGDAERYNGGATDLGRSVWLYDGTATVNIGLTDAEHTRDDGYRYSLPRRLNEAGQLSGFSSRYNGGTSNLGRTAWLYDGTATVNVGPTDAEHTGDDGYRYSSPRDLNEAGQVGGYSYRYNGGATGLGRTAWLYDGTTTVNVGLTDAMHTRDDGWRFSLPEGLNEAGQVCGQSDRYNGGATGFGRTAWLYDGTATVNVGLTDAEHTRDDGYRYSRAVGLNETGQLRGFSSRYNGGAANLGSTAWLYDGTATVNIGLTDAEHTGDDGYRSSRPSHLNEAGQVCGYSERRNGGTSNLGRTAWLYDGTATVNIGLTDTMHTRYGEKRFSEPTHLNEAGQVCGYSNRYKYGANAGQTAWLYDPDLAQTFAIVLSERSDGYAYAEASYLGEDGLVLGWYELFAGDDTCLGDRAFGFTVDDGLWDLGSLVDGGLGAAGWDHLADAWLANGPAYVVGYGLLDDMPDGQMGYLLTPEPATLALVALGGLGVLLRRKRG